MPQEQDEQVLSYECALRVIGRHLDAEPSYLVTIVEVDDGFTVRYQPTRQVLRGRTVQFGHDKLQDLMVFQGAARGCPRSRDRHEGLWANFPDGHQEFLRALGFILDQEHARSLTLDELATEVRVTFVSPNSDDPLQAEKRNLSFDKDNIRSLVRSARKRRAALALVSA